VEALGGGGLTRPQAGGFLPNCQAQLEAALAAPLPAGPPRVAGSSREDALSSIRKRPNEDSPEGRWPGVRSGDSRQPPMETKPISVRWPPAVSFWCRAVFSDHPLHPTNSANRVKPQLFLSGSPAPAARGPGRDGPGCNTLTRNCRAAGRCRPALGHERTPVLGGGDHQEIRVEPSLGRLADPRPMSPVRGAAPLGSTPKLAAACNRLSRHVIGRAFGRPPGLGTMSLRLTWTSREHRHGNVTPPVRRRFRRASSPFPGAVNRDQELC